MTKRTRCELNSMQDDIKQLRERYWQLEGKYRMLLHHLELAEVNYPAKTKLEPIKQDATEV